MKRLFAWIMATVLVLPFFAFGGTGAESRCLSLFHAEDLARETAISEALLPGTQPRKPFREVSETRSDGERFIVRFADGVPEERIRELLRGKDGELLSGASEKVFSLVLENVSAFEAEAGGDLLYCCADRTLETASLPDDPMVVAGLPEYEFLKLPAVWSNATASPEIVVAVLDTGVDRTHEDFSGTEILNGYDFVEKHAGVEKDSTGHGTAVTGIIAATAGNGVGTAGVAYGVRILPVRIAAGSVNIYSSDLVGGLRFAADAGADIINLSFGGYTFSAAEDDAIRYARSKGCILVASAGNGGQTDRGSEPCYPAAYDGVISVGSCDAEGNRSSFSQRSASVDILMPGENILLLGTENGKSVYLHDNGTSYSAAFFSGLAALALSALDENVRFGGDEMEALVNGLDEWAISDGWGAVDGMRLLRDVNLPQITGVRNRSTYIGKVTIGFNRGTATLDGEEFADGETVYQNGMHRLVVSDAAGSRVVEFRLSYVPASYEKRLADGAPAFFYSGGTATLDGLPYQNGTPVTAAGRHAFVLTDPYGEKTTEYFTYDPALPFAVGVEDGGIYTEPVRIRVSAGGEVLSDGASAGRDLIVNTDGTHTLTLKNGERSSELTFTVQTGAIVRENELSRCGLILDEEHGWYAVYGDLLAGIRAYSLEDGSYLGFLDTGCVQGYAFDGDELLIFGEWQFNKLDRASITSGTPVVTSFPIRCDGFACAGGTVFCLADDTLYEVGRENGALTARTSMPGDEIYSDGESVWVYDSETDSFTRYLPERNEKTHLELPFSAEGQRKLFSDGMLFCGHHARNAETGRAIFSFEGYALKTDRGLLYTTEGVYEIATGNCVGGYGNTVSGVTVGETYTCLCGYAGGIRLFPNGVPCYAKALYPLPVVPERTDSFAEYTRLFGEPTALCADGKSYLLAFGKERVLLLWNGEEYSVAELPFAPVGAALSGNSLCAWSSELVWSDGTTVPTEKAIRGCFYAGGELYVLTDRLSVLRGGTLSPTGTEADTACGKGDLLATLKNGRLTVTKAGRETRISVSGGKLMTDGEYLVCGRTVYRAGGTLTPVGVLPGEPLAMCGGYAMTASGLFSLVSQERKSETSLSSGTLAALGEQCGLLLCENGALTRSDYDRTEETVGYAWSDPVLLGCDENGLYDERTEIRYDRGICLLDGNLCPSGTLVEIPGKHTLTLLIPCGICYTRTFSVIPALESISFVNARYHLAVGETASLHIRYLPKETSAVPLLFSVVGDCIELQGDLIVAVAEGNAVIRAETPDGNHFAVCEVVVDGDLLRFENSSGYLVDRTENTLSGVPYGTNAATLFSHLLTVGNVTSSDETLKTGSVIRLIGEDGEELDALTVAVTGDLNGDGLISLGDLCLLQDALRQDELPSVLFALAADMNRSGSVNDRDARVLQDWILFAEGKETRKLPAVRKTDAASLFLPSAVCEGDTVYLTVLLTDCADVSAVSGRVLYDRDAFEFLRSSSYGTELHGAAKKNWASFVLTGGIGEEKTPVVTLEFRVKDGTAGNEAAFCLQDIVVVGDGEYGVGKAELTVPVRNRVYGETSLSLTGATESFDPDVHTYTVYLPYGTPGLLYELCYPEGCSVETENTLFIGSDELNAAFRFRYADGETETYTVKAFRSVEPPQSSDCSLSELTVEGFPFAFDPERLEYRIDVPYDVSSVELHWTASDAGAKVFCGETELRAGKENLITVTVIAEDGARRVYRLYVRRAAAPEESSEAESGENGSLLWLLILPLLAAIAAGGIWWSRRKRKDEQKNGTV